MDGCIACDLMDGRMALPGGRIHETDHWVVEHCIGPLPVGTLILKPRRHCLHIWDLTDPEVTELGPLLRRTSGVVSQIVEADQVYSLLWSHMDGQPGHIHFVLQPARNQDWGKDIKWDRPQAKEIEPVAERARAAFAGS